ncbi:large conductance mechanosensitive channel protein MscL [Winogradskyella immobilis]|uniref:Large-conductance mechanosensitive channel n=1 Tax=Winogradskyella immobilis TaxID=2816852 RepID=A0ABS8EM26_9FLAO|nr:large conductance mechanosensitive channel protein MscL [Winogradskyella immobilis]MCC1484261.1 large conductance mechanosensitive channel protein MscL [Winogradskyella immobilis]MCG0016353.1 large conductance mechanosensitive channel protein MscL [Winogradskyella immobilis]
MKLLKEFKEFAVKGNMIDMAIGIIIGAAFNKVIDVLAKQVILPPLSLLTGKDTFQNQKLILRDEVVDASGIVSIEEVAVAYGALLEVFFDFLIIGFTIFVVVKFMNRLKRKAQDTEDKTVATPKDIQLLSDLKSLMEEQNNLLKSNLNN